MRLLDLYCGAGGATQGYRNAGFTEIWGVDINPQPNYPGDHFIQADIFDPDNPFDLWPIDWPQFDLIHASPPCQAYSKLRNLSTNEHPDLVEPTRQLLRAFGAPYVIENVVGAPLIYPITLCGSMFGLRVWRHRIFEVSWAGAWLLPHCRHQEHPEPLDVTGTGGPSNKPRSKPGGGLSRKPKNLAEAREAMGIDWMTRKELSQAIPPAYTEYIGREFIYQMAEEDWHWQHAT